MTKINWINNKTPNFKNIENILQPSLNLNQMTNYGPVVKSLEKFFTEKLSIEENKCVIAVANGAVGLHGLVSGINIYHDKNFNYVTQSFTFPCSAQGPLSNSKIVDIDDDLSLNLDLIDPEKIDGIIVTNLFGHVCDINKYTDWSNKYNKILLFDNATVSSTEYKCKNSLNYGTGSIVSLHHTKPIGFGEGGLIVVDKKYENHVRKCLNFGFNIKDGNLSWNRNGSNYKMSEISAVFIMDYLTQFDFIVKKHRELYGYFLKKSVGLNIKKFPNYSNDIPFVSCIPVIFNKTINNDILFQLEMLGVTARKYYNPLESKKVSDDIYSRIVCFPCHIDMTKDDIDNIIEKIKMFM